MANLETRLAALEHAAVEKQKRTVVSKRAITQEEAAAAYQRFLSIPWKPSPEWENITPERADRMYRKACRGQ